MRERAGSVIEIEKGQDRKLDLPAMAAALADSGLTTVLVEGGGGLAAALLRADLVDEVHWMLAPKLIGSEGLSGLGPLALGALGEAVVIEPLDFTIPGIGKNGFTQAGPDIHVHGLVRRNAKTVGAGRRKISRSAGRRGTKA
jgi:riboflavin biosynthesis pyrimidine reductase